MGDIVVRNTSVNEDKYVYTITFYTPSDEVNACNSGMAVTKLAKAMQVYYDMPIIVERYLSGTPQLSKWTMILQGTEFNLNNFVQHVKSFVRLKD